MKDKTAEMLNTVVGYLGIGVFFTSIIFYFDGRLGLIQSILVMAVGFCMNAAATFSELTRSEQSKQWLTDFMNAALIGDVERLKNVIRGDNNGST